jgi:hypothetical protein
MVAEFSLLLTCGISLIWCLMPRAQVTAGFFRIQMLLVMGLSALGVLAMGQLTSGSGDPLSSTLLFRARVFSSIAIGFAYFGSIAWTLDRRPVGTWAMVGILGATLISLICSRGATMGLTTSAGAFHLLSSFSTAFLLGAAVTGMLLGHWYLTAPTMSIEPLKTLCWYFAAAVLLRFLVSLSGWMIAGDELHRGLHWTWFSLRWLAGILGPMAISIMALRILRYRNTQAATGVLFAGVILCFIGEMSAALLYSELRASF